MEGGCVATRQAMIGCRMNQEAYGRGILDIDDTLLVDGENREAHQGVGGRAVLRSTDALMDDQQTTFRAMV